MESKGAQSNIISTVLIILLVVASIAIIGVILLNVLHRGSEQIQASVSCNDVVLTPKQCAYNDSSTYELFQIKISSNADLVGITLISENKNGGTTMNVINRSQLGNIQNLQTSSFLFLNDNRNNSSSKFSIYSAIKTSDGAAINCPISQAIACSGPTELTNAPTITAVNENSDILNDSVYARYRLHDELGENSTFAIDWSGNGRNATIINANYINDSFKKGLKLVSTLSTASGIFMGRPGDFNFGYYQPWSLAIWVRQDVNNTNTSLTGNLFPELAKKGFNDAGWVLTLGMVISCNGIDSTWKPGDCVEWGYSDANSNGLLVYTNGTDFFDNKWHQIVGTYDGSGNNTGFNIYIDGKAMPIVRADNTNISDHWGTGQEYNVRAQVGYMTGFYYDSGTPFTGSISDIIFFNKTLSLREVEELYNSTSG